MPNWVITKIVATEPQKVVEALTKVVGENQRIVDFNQLIPMPQDLVDVQKGSCSFNVNMPAFIGDKNFPVIPTMSKEYNETISQKEFVDKLIDNEEFVEELSNYLRYDKKDSYAKKALESFIKGFFNHKRYGFIDWYDWSLEKWGTKWNARNDSFVDETWGVEFSTAWSIPTNILYELAKICPIRVAFADEDIGYNCGVYDIFIDENGEVYEDCIMNESEELARVIWGYTEYSDFYEITKREFNKMKKAMNAVEAQLNTLMTVEQLKKDFEGIQL